MTEQLVYIDSNVFLFPIIYDEDLNNRKKSSLVSRSKELLRNVADGRLVAYTSWLTWDEVVWNVLRTLGAADSIEAGRKLLNFPKLRFVECGETVMLRAQEMRDKFELDPRDAIHCASAATKNLKVVISDNSHLDRCSSVKRVSIEDYVSQ